MKQCDLIINFGKEYGEENELKITIGKIDESVLDQQLPLQGVANHLLENPELIQKILDNLSSISNESISPSSGLANITLKDLMNKIPIQEGWVPIDKLKDFNYDIIYVNRNNPGSGLRIQGRKIVVYRNGLNRLNRTLKANILIDKLRLDKKTKDILSEIINYLKTQKNPDGTPLISGDYTYKKLCKDYVINPNRFPSEIKINGKTLDLEYFFGKLLEDLDEYKNIEYNTGFLNELKYKIKERKSVDGGYQISIESLQKLINKYYPDKKFKDVNQMKKILKELILEDTVFPYRIERLLKTIEDDGTQRVIGIKLNNIYPGTVQELIGNRETVQNNLEYVKTERGYNIYKLADREIYYVLNGIISQTNKIGHRPFRTEEDAIKYINSKIGSSKLSKAIIIPTMSTTDELLTLYVDEYKFVPTEGSVIEVVEYDESEGPYSTTASNIIKSDTFQEFLNRISAQKEQLKISSTNTMNITEREIDMILKNIDTPYKAVIFLREFYKNNRKLTVEEIIDKINKTKQTYFYSIRNTSGKANLVRVNPKNPFVKIDEKTKETYDIPKREVIRNLIKAIERQLEGSGFTVRLMTQSEIKTEFPGRELANGFVTGNTIVINSTTASILTPLHEYAHVFLGIIKAQSPEKYREIVQRIISTYSSYTRRLGGNTIQKQYERIKATYPGISEEGIYEEIFANIFSDYILGHHYGDFIGLDISKIEEELPNIFSLSGKNIMLKNIWKYPLSRLASIMSEIQADQAGWFERVNKRFKQNREASNWIQQQINDKKIEENCNI